MLLILLILQKPKLLLVLYNLLTVEGNTVVQFARVIQFRPTVKNYNCPKYTNQDIAFLQDILYLPIVIVKEWLLPVIYANHVT